MIGEKDMAVGMPPPDRIMRLVSGVFYNPALLNDGIGSLTANGFRRRDMCFVGTRDALAGLDLVMTDAPRKLRAIRALSGQVEVVGSSGALLGELERVAQRESESRLRPGDLLFGLFEKFSEHIHRNAIVLTVSAADAGLLHSGSLILLRHSAHPVQTHEFTLMHPTVSESATTKGKS